MLTISKHHLLRLQTLSGISTPCCTKAQSFNRENVKRNSIKLEKERKVKKEEKKWHRKRC
jgi:hypothetical protein